MERLQCAVGIVVILLLCWLWSSNRSNIPWRAVAWGMGLQLMLAGFMMLFPPGVAFFDWLGSLVTQFLSFAQIGAVFLFGNLAKNEQNAVFGFQFAITITSVIVFFSACVAVLYYYNIMQRIVRGMSWILERTMRTTAVESLSTAANIFLGQTEAPLLVRHYLPKASASELFAIMVGGFATIAGSTLGVYVAMGIPANYLIIASVLAAPGGLALAKMAHPPNSSATQKVTHTDPIIPSGNVIDAVCYGAMDGFKLAVNVIVVLLAFKALVALTDAFIGWGAGSLAGIGMVGVPSSLDQILAWVFLPFSWLLGIPSNESFAFASLLGTKISQTEFIAYDQLATLTKSGVLSPRTVILASVALCGFANFLSIGIQIGGIGMMAPDRRSEIARMGFKAMAIGALANILAAAICGLFL